MMVEIQTDLEPNNPILFRQSESLLEWKMIEMKLVVKEDQQTRKVIIIVTFSIFDLEITI